MKTTTWTFSRERWLNAQTAWTVFYANASTEMRDEWPSWRKLAAETAAIIDPPTGDRFDSWNDDDPSQLAILTRAIRETPRLLEDAIRSSDVHSWAAVIAVLCRQRDAIRADLDERLQAEEDAWTAAKAAERAEASAALERIGWRS
jgi:hypothetical protein